MVNELYFVINVICLFLFAMVLFKERQSQKANNKKFNMFYVLTWGILVFCLIDCYWGLIAAKVIKTKTSTFYFTTMVLYVFVSIVSFFCRF